MPQLLPRGDQGKRFPENNMHHRKIFMNRQSRCAQGTEHCNHPFKLAFFTVLASAGWGGPSVQVSTTHFQELAWWAAHFSPRFCQPDIWQTMSPKHNRENNLLCQTYNLLICCSSDGFFPRQRQRCAFERRHLISRSLAAFEQAGRASLRECESEIEMF